MEYKINYNTINYLLIDNKLSGGDDGVESQDVVYDNILYHVCILIVEKVQCRFGSQQSCSLLDILWW